MSINASCTGQSTDLALTEPGSEGDDDRDQAFHDLLDEESECVCAAILIWSRHPHISTTIQLPDPVQ